MAQDIQIFSVTVATGTSKLNPQVNQLRMPARVVDEIEVQVPPGPRGEVGFWLGSSGSPVIPPTLNTWIVTDNEVIHWPLEDFWDSGSWQITAYNTGLYSHTLTVRFLLSLPQRRAGATPAPLTAAQLGAVPVAAGAPAPVGPGQALPVPPPLPPPPLPPPLGLP